MAFRKRNVGLSRTTADASPTPPRPAPGVRPSPLDGRPVTSTGTASLDASLGGHAGLALGCALLLEEGGSTDYGGALLRFYAAEGILHGHAVHAVGAPEGWARELPGVVVEEDKKAHGREVEGERMKIAWRYERLGAGAAGRAPPASLSSSAGESMRGNPAERLPDSAAAVEPFCHNFDLAKRLAIPSGATVDYLPIEIRPQLAPFQAVLQKLASQLSSSPPNALHRLVIPSLLSPAFYPPHASEPQNVLQFFHAIRSLLRQFPNKLTAMVSLPLELYPRSTGLVRWLEHLSDGVLELTPFPHRIDIDEPSTASAPAGSQEERPQGLVKVHKLPVLHDRGGGGGGLQGHGDDLAFTVSRRKFSIKPFNLPPADGGAEDTKGKAERSKADMEF